MLSRAPEDGLSEFVSAIRAVLPGAKGYRDGTLVATVGSTSWFDVGLAAGSSHTYTVSAIDAAGNASAQTAGLATATLSVAPPDVVAPTVPTGVSASSTAYSSATVTWTASTDAVGVTSYTILRDGAVISKVAGTVTTFTDVSTAPVHTYAYTVKASDAAGNTSVASGAASVTTPAYVPAADATPPTTPAGLTATAVSGTEVDLAWTASTDNIGVAGYNVYRDGTKINTAPVGSISYSDTGLGAGVSTPMPSARSMPGPTRARAAPPGVVPGARLLLRPPTPTTPRTA
jgi:chitodextrinase